MRAVQYTAFGDRPAVVELPIPPVADDGALIRVEVTGICRSDVHAWSGHDGSVSVPMVPGHEFVGTVVSTGAGTRRFHAGDRVTVPFVCGCGTCSECLSGRAQTCPNQSQPGFSHDGSFAELVAIRNADFNLVAVPASIDSASAALLGCRFATAYHALTGQARLTAGDWVAVIGCGGVGLSAVMIAAALGAHVIAIDVAPAALETAARLGAESVIDSSGVSIDAVVERVAAITGGGADIAVEALGREETIALGLQLLRPGGRHVQIGLVSGSPRVPVATLIARELTLIGAHGMAAADYGGLLDLVASGALRPSAMVSREITLEEIPVAMEQLADGVSHPGVTVARIRGKGSGTFSGRNGVD
jgi:alcohol dehydrogenase